MEVLMISEALQLAMEQYVMTTTNSELSCRISSACMITLQVPSLYEPI